MKVGLSFSLNAQVIPARRRPKMSACWPQLVTIGNWGIEAFRAKKNAEERFIRTHVIVSKAKRQSSSKFRDAARHPMLIDSNVRSAHGLFVEIG